MASSSNTFSYVEFFDGSIYQLIDTVNHKIFYVGSTKQTLEDRLLKHISNAFNKCRGDYNCRNYRYIREIGKENIIITQIVEFDFLTKDKIFELEQYWIDIIKPQCNSYKSTLLNGEKGYRSKQQLHHINTLGKQRITCDCHMQYPYSHRNEHLISKKHNRRMELLAMLD